MRPAFVLATLAVLFACSSSEDSATAPGACTPTGVSSGTLRAAVDGRTWTADGVAQSPSGDGVQVTSAPGDGWRLTLVAQTSAGGQGVTEALAEGPVEVSLVEGSGNFAVVYPAEGGTSYTTNDGGGTAVLLSSESGLNACFSFEAGGADGTLTVTEGQLSAP